MVPDMGIIYDRDMRIWPCIHFVSVYAYSTRNVHLGCYKYIYIYLINLIFVISIYLKNIISEKWSSIIVRLLKGEYHSAAYKYHLQIKLYTF